MKLIDRLSRQFATDIVTKPATYLIISISILFISIVGILKIESSFSVKIWLDPSDQRIVDLKKHENSFGSSSTIDVILYSKNSIFTEKTLKDIQNLTEDMWTIKDVVRVESISNFSWIDTFEDDIDISPFINEDFSFSSKAIKEKKDIATTDEQIVNNIVSSSSRLAIIRAFLKSDSKDRKHQEIVEQTEKLIAKKYSSQDYKIHLGGISTINESLRRASSRDMKLVFPLIITLLITILFYFFRSLLGVAYPFIVIISTIIFTFGAEGFLGLKFNNIIAAVPAILMSIGLADAIHILVSYRHCILFEKMSNEAAAIKSLTKNFLPTILTSITTAIGFFSLTSANIRPIHDLGMLSGIGTISAWFFTYFILGAILKYTKVKELPKRKNPVHLDWIFNFCSKYKMPINIIFPLLAIVMIIFGFKNTINSDPIEYFSKSTDIKKTFTLIEKEFGGSRAIELVFDSGTQEGIKDPDFLNRCDKFLSWLNTQEEIIRLTSIVQIVKKMNKTLHNGDKSFYKVPLKRREIADQLFLYTLGLPAGVDLKNQVTIDNRKFRAILMWNINDTTTAGTKTDEYINKAKTFGLDVYEGGQSPIYNRINKLVVKTFFTSMGISIPLIFLIILFVFKDFLLASLSLAPNIFPLAIASGLMYFNGDEINIGNVIVFSVCLGIAVDDTIHFIANYKTNLIRGLSKQDAIKATLEQTGKALILTTVMLVFGFGLFILGEFVPNQKFGLYCAIILFLALIADLILLPSILLATKDR